MSNLWATKYGSVESFVWPSLGFWCSKNNLSSILTTCPYFDNLEFDSFGAGGLQHHFIMSVTIAVGILTLSVN